MPKLTPSQSVNVAKGIYSILTSTHVEEYFNRSIRDNFLLSEAKSFKSKSGFTCWQVESGFAIATMGKSDSPFKNEALISVRGTSKWIDWISDAHAGVSLIDGQLIHSGFKKIFNPLQSELSKFFIENRPHRVHVVGHSMGAAVAQLVAYWAKNNAGTEPILYTYASPRVGSQAFATKLTTQLGADNIYRVAHDIDPVTMVPVWPFVHAPLPGSEYGIRFSGNRVLSYKAHFIDNYVDAISGFDSWEALRKAPQKPAEPSKIEQWLSTGDTVLRMTAPGLYLCQDAIKYVLKKVLELTGIVVQGAVMSISTSLDLCAMALVTGAKKTVELGGLVKQLMIRILQTVGIYVDIAKDLTREFIRWVLECMMQAVYTLAKTAMRLALK